MRVPPIFILGVPRSGTTLLRAILDSHSAIASGPETPWLGGHQPRSLMSLWQALRDEPWGYCASYGMPREVPTEAARAFLDTLMTRYAQARGKKRWAEKTPDNALHLDFLFALAPDARCIHIVRDGLDVAMSTSIIAPHRRGISEFLESRIGLGPDAPTVPNSPLAALLRWRHWNSLIERSLQGRGHHRLSYERLVSEPEATLRELMAFIDEPFEPSMLDYAKARHDFPRWEWGSADVQAQAAITRARIGRARRELSAEMYALLEPLARGASPVPGAWAGAAPPGAADLAAAVNAFASGLGLDALDESEAGPLAWLWTRGLAGDWSGKRIDYTGPAAHPLPWLLALQGASISGPPLSPSLASLARGLRVIVNAPDQRRPADARIAVGGPPSSGPAARHAPTFILWPGSPTPAAITVQS